MIHILAFCCAEQEKQAQFIQIWEWYIVCLTAENIRWPQKCGRPPPVNRDSLTQL